MSKTIITVNVTNAASINCWGVVNSLQVQHTHTKSDHIRFNSVYLYYIIIAYIIKAPCGFEAVGSSL